VAEGSGWKTAGKVALGVGAVVGVGWLFKKAIEGSLVVGAAVGAGLTAAVAGALAEQGVLVQLPGAEAPPGAGSTLTEAAGEAAALRALCREGPGKDTCLLTGDRLARLKAEGVRFWATPGASAPPTAGPA
jgi:hypothetical protein